MYILNKCMITLNYKVTWNSTLSEKFNFDGTTWWFIGEGIWFVHQPNKHYLPSQKVALEHRSQRVESHDLLLCALLYRPCSRRWLQTKSS